MAHCTSAYATTPSHAPLLHVDMQTPIHRAYMNLPQGPQLWVLSKLQECFVNRRQKHILLVANDMQTDQRKE